MGNNLDLLTGDVGEFLREDPIAARDAIKRMAARQSLKMFLQLMWKAVEPANPFTDGWHIDAMCDHLSAVTEGQIQKLLINVPPGTMKSLMTCVFWPAWEWGPRDLTSNRVVSFSYSSGLTERDNLRFRNLITDPRYTRLWGNQFTLVKENEALVQNDKTGWKQATSFGGTATGLRGDRVIIDDPHNVSKSESPTIMEHTIRFFNETLPSRMNDPKVSASVVIMQRVNEGDVSGEILAKGLDYVHLMLPMRFEKARRCTVPVTGFVDPRTEEGELIWPARMPEKVVRKLESQMGKYAVAGQFQQNPVPRGGGIIQRESWKVWDAKAMRLMGIGAVEPGKLIFPKFDYVLGSLDCAMTEQTENDPSAMSIWGVWRDWMDQPRVMLMRTWSDHLNINDLVNKTVETMRRFKADQLVIENKASGISVQQEMLRLFSAEKFGVTMYDPRRDGGGDKIARAYAVQPIFEQGLIYIPEEDPSNPARAWVKEALDQVSKFPKGAHDDIVDTITQAVKFLRDNGMIIRNDERERDKDAAMMHKNDGAQDPLYDV